MAATTVRVLAMMGLAAVTGTSASDSSWPPSTSSRKRFYIDSSTLVTWHGAYGQCLRNNSRLARVESEDENKQVTTMINSINPPFNGYWIGGNDLAKEGEFLWLYSGQALKYTNWHGGEPSNSAAAGENCVSYATGAWGDDRYAWNDDSCNQELHFVCEYYGDVVDWRIEPHQ